MNRVYLPPGYSHMKCYNLYEQKCKDEGVDDKIVSYGMYKNIMRSYNIDKDPPKVDTCTFCDKIKLQRQAAKAANDQGQCRILKINKQVHIRKVRASRDLMHVYIEDKDPTLAAICIDLQQTLATPRLTTNVQYYKRKMWTYKFCIHNLKGNGAHLYVWNEATAKRGSSEIGSCLIHHINNFIPDIANKLIIFSDNCGGQNKNINLCLLMLRFIQSGRFHTIKNYYLLPGHSYTCPATGTLGTLRKLLLVNRFTPLHITSH